jgi:hypothetical protein
LLTLTLTLMLTPASVPKAVLALTPAQMLTLLQAMVMT